MRLHCRQISYEIVKRFLLLTFCDFVSRSTALILLSKTSFDVPVSHCVAYETVTDVECVEKELFAYSDLRAAHSEKVLVGIHQPKKDKCRICVAGGRNEVDADVLAGHTAEKIAVNNYHLERQKDETPGTVVCSMDLQKVLATPHGKSMLFGYSRKYAVYNETIYESREKRGICYLWGECDAKRGSNEVASVLYNYLVGKDTGETRNVFVFCDSCSGQNKNRAVVGMIHYFLVRAKFVRTVEITFLVPGHTYMQCDSAHSVIERSVERQLVYAPSQWRTIVQMAIKDQNKLPYEVRDLKTEDVLDWLSLGSSMFTQAGWKSFRQIRIDAVDLTSIEVRKSIDDPWSILNVKKRRGRPPNPSGGVFFDLPNRVYTRKLSISDAKFRDLTSLCENNIIPQCWHHEYFALNP